MSVEVPAPEAVRGLGDQLAAAGFAAAEAVSAELRSWWTWPREALRERLLPGAPSVATGSVWANRDLKRFERHNAAAGVLFRLLTVGQRIDADRAGRELPAMLLQSLDRAGITQEQDGALFARLRVVPMFGLFLLADFPSARKTLGKAYVQLGLDSAQLAAMVIADARGGSRALDVCTGGGIQALLLARRYDQVEGTDINPRAVAMARANAALNGLDDRVEFRVADLFDGCTGQYDMVAANPPFMFLPPEAARTNLTGDGGTFGIEITLRILDGLPSRLPEDGHAFVYTQGPRIGGRCMLTARATEALRFQGLDVDLEEIHRGYWAPFREFYKEMHVEWLSCYRIRVRRTGNARLICRPARGWRAAVLRASVALERWGAA